METHHQISRHQEEQTSSLFPLITRYNSSIHNDNTSDDDDNNNTILTTTITGCHQTNSHVHDDDDDDDDDDDGNVNTRPFNVSEAVKREVSKDIKSHKYKCRYLDNVKDSLFTLLHDELCTFQHHHDVHQKSNLPLSSHKINNASKVFENLRFGPLRICRLEGLVNHLKDSFLKTSATTKTSFQPSTNPLKIVQVQCLQDDFYLKLLDWSLVSGYLAVGVDNTVIVWHPIFNARTTSIQQQRHDEDNTPPPPLNPTNSSTTRLESIPHDALRLQFPIDANNESSQESPGVANRDFLVTSVCWNYQSASTLAVGYRSGAVTVWDVEAGVPIRTYLNHHHRVGSLDWCGPIISSGSRDKSIISRDIRTPGDITFRWDSHKQEVCGISWSPEGCGTDGILASGGNDNAVFIWQLGYDEPVLRLKEHMAAVKALAWSPYYSGLLATGGGTNDRSARLWDIRTGASNITEQETQTSNISRASMLTCVDSGSQICNVVWSRTSQQLLTTHGFTLNQIILWDVMNSESSNVINTDNHREATTITANYHNNSGTPNNPTELNLYNSNLNSNNTSLNFFLNKAGVFEGHDARVLFLAMNPSGDIVATAAGDETVRFWKFFPPIKHNKKTESVNDLGHSNRFLNGLL